MGKKQKKSREKGKTIGFHIRNWKWILLIIELVSFSAIFLGLFLNPYILKWMLGKEQMFSDYTVLLIYKLEIFLIVFGALLWLLHHSYLKNCSDRAKEVTLNIIVFLISFIIVIALMEAGTRVIAPQKTLSQLISSSPAIYEEGEFISWQYKPDSESKMITGEFNISYKINSMGMRSDEINPTKKRMLVLGDSFAAGFGVEQEEAFPALLEDILNIDVLNAGIDGYSPDTEYVYLKNNIEELKPDAVLLAFYAGNDVLDISKNDWTAEDGLPIKIRSNVLEVIDNRIALKDRLSNPYRAGFRGYIDIILSKYSHLYISLKKLTVPKGNLEIVPLLTEPSEEITANWAKTKILINEMKKLSEEHGASFTIVIIPARVQVRDYEWENVRKKFKDDVKRDLVQEKLTAWCEDEGILCIDLLKELVSEEDLYYVIDMHFNKKGHERAAEIISRELAD